MRGFNCCGGRRVEGVSELRPPRPLTAQSVSMKRPAWKQPAEKVWGWNKEQTLKLREGLLGGGEL